MYNLIKKSIIFFENQSLNFNGWIISFFTLLGLNLFFQYITQNFKNVSVEYFIGEVIQPYYFILYLTIVIFLYLLLKVKNRKLKIKSSNSNITQVEKHNEKLMVNILNFVLWGFWSIIFWPIIDKVILKDSFHLSFYIYDSVIGIFQKMITFFGPISPVGILYGTRIETIFIIIFVGVYVYIKTQSILKTVISSFGVYTIFYVSVALPSIVVFLMTLFNGGNVMEITNLDIVKFFNTPLNYFGMAKRDFSVVFFYKISLVYNIIFVLLLIWFQYLWNKKILIALFKNIRIPQMIFNEGLLVIGMLIGIYYIPNNLTSDIFSWLVFLNLILSIFFSWLFSVIINDIEDYKIDKISNKSRPLVVNIISKKIYLNYGYIFLFLSLLLSITVSNKIFVIIVLYNLLTIIYSKYPFKLKRIPWIAGMVSSLASLFIFLIGFLLITGNHITSVFPWRVIFFLFISYAFILPIKDLKDITSDKENNVLTVANLFGDSNARIYFGVVIFLLFICSVFVFTAYNLFWLAVFCGIISYWIVNNKKNTNNILLYKILIMVIVYLVGMYFV